MSEIPFLTTIPASSLNALIRAVGPIAVDDIEAVCEVLIDLRTEAYEKGRADAVAKARRFPLPAEEEAPNAR